MARVVSGLFLRGDPAECWWRMTGTVQKAAVQLADASREIYRVTGDPVLRHQDFTSWDALLTYIGEFARDRRVGFVVDEFAYYCDGSLELPSVLQRWWDRVGRQTQAMVILVGSHVAFMETLVLGGQALYILRALAEGKTQPSDIAMTAGYRAASDVMPFLGRYLFTVFREAAGRRGRLDRWCSIEA